MSGGVRIEADDDVGVIVIDNPPVNAGSQQVRAGIISSLRELAGDGRYRAVVLIGAGKTFISGSDLREFSGPISEPQMPAVVAAIEACPKPVVAALSGTALGGGLEIALGCDARVAVAGTKVGLPEVTLGIIPGAGGTVRLPRLIGLPAAIDLITTGRRIDAEQAAGLGLVDDVVAHDLRGAARSRARALTGKRRAVDLPVLPVDQAAVEVAVTTALKKGRARPAVIAAIAAIRRSANMPAGEALRHERAAFQALRVSEEASALRYLFFAERQALRAVAPPDDAGRAMRAVGVIGGGTMGAAIASAFSDAAFAVDIVDVDEAAAARAIDRIRDIEARAVRSGRVTQAEADERVARVRPHAALSGVADADVVVEAVWEDFDAKADVLKRLEKVVKPGAIIASNTSYLDLDALAATTTNAANVVGMHFFAPANVMRLVEVVRGRQTAAPVLATAFAIVRRLGKLPIVTGVCEGFIGNRIYSEYRKQCEFMLEEGCLPEQIDAALEGFGFAMGPFAVGDLSGLDIAWRNRKRRAGMRNPAVRYSRILDRLCEMGRFGRKTGAGWYTYRDGRTEHDPAVQALISEESAARGIVRRRFTNEEIVRRALGAIVNEAGLVLKDGISERPSDIDLVMVNGFGFPKHKGGPAFWARHLDASALVLAIDEVSQSVGYGFCRADLARLTATAPFGD